MHPLRLALLVPLIAAAAPLPPAAELVAAAPAARMHLPAPAVTRIGSGFGPRPHEFHTGIDLMAPGGSPVLAAEAGTVVFAGRYYAYGNMIDIQDADGVVTRYAHLKRIDPGIRPGRHVDGGQHLGQVGATGRAHGTHLHFEVRIDNHPVDPLPWLLGPAQSVPTEVAEAPAPRRRR